MIVKGVEIINEKEDPKTLKVEDVVIMVVSNQDENDYDYIDLDNVGIKMIIVDVVKIIYHPEIEKVDNLKVDFVEDVKDNYNQRRVEGIRNLNVNVEMIDDDN